MKVRLIHAAMLLCGALSCTKMDLPGNPDEQDFPAALFSVSLHETRCYKEYDYLVADGGSISGDGTSLTVTSWNTIELSLTSDDADFIGANVASSNTGSIAVTRIDGTHYQLSYVSDGESDIRVWTTAKEISFHLDSRDFIPLEGIRMRVDGKEFTVRADLTLPSPYDKESPYSWGPERVRSDMVYFSDCTDGRPYEIEIVDLVPSNASWRSIAKLLVVNTGSLASDRSQWFDDADDILYERNDIRDASNILGKKILWTPDSASEGKTYNTRFLIVTFKTNFRDYSSPREGIGYTTIFCGRETR